MIGPVLFLAGGLAVILTVTSLLHSGEGEPAEPIPLPSLDDAPSPKSSDKPSGGSGIAATDDEVEALARVVRSEAGGGTQAERRSVAWTVRNRFRGKSIFDVEHPWREQKGAKPPFSSRQDARDEDRDLAKTVLRADQGDDPTGGATAFFEPKMQDAFYKAGELARAGETGDRVIDGVKLTDITRFKSYKLDADGVRKKWSPGSALCAKAGRFEFWGSARLLAQRGGEVKTIVSGPGYHTPADVAALARAVENAGGSSCEEQQAVAWAIRNRAAFADASVEEVCGGIPGDTPASPWSREVAVAVLLQPEGADPTSGAVEFWRPGAQRIGRALGDVYRARRASGDLLGASDFAPWCDYGTEDEVRAAFAAAGLRVVGLVGTLELLA